MSVHIGLGEPVDQASLRRGERPDAGRAVKPQQCERPPRTVPNGPLETRAVLALDADGAVDGEAAGPAPRAHVRRGGRVQEVTRVFDVDPVSGPVRVAGGAQPDAVLADADIEASVEAPVAASIGSLAANVVATSEVDLDSRRSSVRTMETSQGNLATDALLWQVQERASSLACLRRTWPSRVRSDSLVISAAQPNK